MTSANTTSASLREPLSVAVDYDPFADAPLARVVPSTEAQREIWLAAKLERDASLAYNESSSLRLSGRLDAARLRAALQSLTDRHETLRATLSANGEELLIAEHVDLDWRVRDLSPLDGAARDAEIAATLQRVVDTPFDLEKGPLLRAELLRLADDDHLLVVTAHHVVCDGWSWGVLVNELAALYRGTAASALAVADSYGDYALEQAARPGTDEYRGDEAYWLGRFTGTAPSLDLPTDRPRPRQRTFASRREDRVLDAALISGLKAFGAKRRSSLFATLACGFGVLLQRLSGQDDIVIGIPAAGQAAGGHQSLVGHCVNVLPLRTSIEPAMPMNDILDHVRSDLLDAFDHQQYTVGTLLKRLALARDASRLTLVSVLFNLDQALDESRIDFGGLDFRFFGNPRTFENFELFVNAVQVGGALRLECQYNSDLFDAVTVRRWLEGYETLLRAWLAAPEANAGALSMVSPAEFEALKRLQSAPTPFERDALVCDLIFAQAKRTPDRAAIRDAAKRWTYAELASRAHAIAHALRARNVGSGALVGLSMQRSGDMIAAALGVLEAGAAYVPLDPSFPAERLRFMAEDANLALLLTESVLGKVIDWPAERTLLLDVPDAIGMAPAAGAPRSGTDANAPAYVIYTSGSTGKPKGVRVPHRAVVNFLTSMQREPGLTADDRMVAVTTLSFDIAVLELFLPLTVGAEVVIALREQAMDGHALGDLLAASEATVMQATPATWRLLLEADWRGPPGFKALCGGEALSRELAVELLPRCASLWNMYGPTETTVWSTCCRIEHPERGIPIGHPIANTTVWILDAERKPCPIGVPGEIAIGGAGVTLGYLDRPELTADRFIADSYADTGNMLYRTGDRGRWRNDGTLEHLGRLDFQVKVRGFRIELGEIESMLVAQPGVARAVALAREDRVNDVRLVAYVVARDGTKLEEKALQTALRARLPDYMIPQHILVLAAIPQLPNGKIDRKALPAPQRNVDTTRERIAPRDEREQRIAAAMEEILALPELGIHDDFFALGGHSLLAAQLTARLNREFGVTLSFRTLFDAPTIAGLGAAIGKQLDSGTAIKLEPIARRPDQSRAPLSLQQQRLWLLEEMNPGRVTYNTPSAHRLRGRLDEAAFERAFADMVQRQPSLRTAIRREGDRLEQVIEPTIDLKLFPAEDLSALAPDARDARLMSRLQELTDTPFDLTRAPLFRARMFKLGPDEHVLFFMPHHIVWDGWSFDLLYVEIPELYRAHMEGRPPTLPPLPVSYGDFAEWHSRWLEGPQLQTQLAFWRDRLAEVGEPKNLPTDKPRRPGMSGEGRTEWIRVSKEQTEAMHAVARSADATLNMTLLALYYVMLFGMTGQRDLVVGTPVRGRNLTEVESLMGYFTNLVPLHISVKPEQPFVDFVREVKRVVIDSFGNPDVPLEHLQRELRVRHGGGALLYQALFSFQDARQRATNWAGLSHEQILLFQNGATEDLGLWFLENDKGMIGGVTYNADILRADTARMLRARYLEFLQRVIADARQPIRALTRLSDEELARIRQWNVLPPAATTPAHLHEAFEAQMDRAPSATALTFGSWGTSYGEIEQRANRIAACLRKRGARDGTVVAVIANPGANRLATLLGIFKAGGICLPLDPADHPARLKSLLADADPAIVVGDSRLEKELDWPRARALWFDTDATEIMAAANTRVPHAGTSADAPAIAIYTPDATGNARGMLFSHHAVGAVLAALRRVLGVDAGSRVLGTSRVDTAMSLLESLLPIAEGGEFVQAGHDEVARGDALARLLGESKSDIVFATAEIWQSMLDAGDAPCSAAKAVCVGGTPRPDIAERIATHHASLWNALLTEASLIASCGRVESPADCIHAGAPLGTGGIWVLDAAGQPRPIGALGEICVEPLGTRFGKQSAATAAGETIESPAGDGRVLAHTGYRGRWLVDGAIEELGRLDRRLRVQGRIVEPIEIETALCALPGVDRAIAVAREDRSGKTQFVAYVAQIEGAKLDGAALRAALAPVLPAQMIPQQIVVLGSLPTLANGEVDIAVLPAPVERDGSGTAGEDALSPREQLLASIWMELLGVPRVGATDNFFDLGGHSLLAMSMAAKVEKQTRTRLNLLKIANSTLGVLAAELPETAGTGAPVESQASIGQRVRSLFGLGKRPAGK